jgi:hypothetical protein
MTAQIGEGRRIRRSTDTANSTDETGSELPDAGRWPLPENPPFDFGLRRANVV